MHLSAQPTPSPLADAPSGRALAIELARRWGSARRAALRTVVPEAPDDADEDALLALAWSRDRDASMRRVFDNSRILGQSFARFYRVDLTLPDLSELLGGLGTPCHVGGFARVESEPAARSLASPCAAGSSALPPCDHWRESLAGLVSGLSSSVHFTRLESPASGGTGCVDLLHVYAESPLRWGPVPTEITDAFEGVLSLARRIDPGARLSLLGRVEGVIHYRLDPSAPAAACGTCTATFDLATVVDRALQRRFPGVTFREASPRPVLPDSP